MRRRDCTVPDILIRVAIFLFCGAMAGFLVTYGLFLRPANNPKHTQLSDERISELWSLHAPSEWGEPDSGSIFAWIGVRIEWIGSETVVFDTYANQRPNIIRQYTIGFPFGALTGTYIGDHITPIELKHLIDNQYHYQRGSRLNPRYLPLGIEPVGLISNILFYTVVLRILFEIRRVAVHKIRRRRGLCPYCKYSLEKSGVDRCPECGMEAIRS